MSGRRSRPVESDSVPHSSDMDVHRECIDTINSYKARIEKLESALRETEIERDTLKAGYEEFTRELSEKSEQLSREVSQEFSLEIKLLKQENEEQNRIIRRMVLDNTLKVREKDIVIAGVKESKEEDVKKTVLNLFRKIQETYIKTHHQTKDSEYMKEITDDDLDLVYRIGKNPSTPPRNILVTFTLLSAKHKVMKMKQVLIPNKTNRIFISESMTPELKALHRDLKAISVAATKLKLSNRIVGNKIIVDKIPYNCTQLHLLPECLREATIQIKEVKGGLAYRGEKAYLSNFYPSPITVDGQRFQSVEQYFQYRKSITCGDMTIASQILKSSSPLDIKFLGDKVEENARWRDIRLQVLYDGVCAKFSTDKDLADKLMKTKGCELVEATTDPFFGAGVGYGSQTWKDRSWSGQNVNGRMVMRVRKLLMDRHHPGPTVNADQEGEATNPHPSTQE